MYLIDALKVFDRTQGKRNQILRKNFRYKEIVKESETKAVTSKSYESESRSEADEKKENRTWNSHMEGHNGLRNSSDDRSFEKQKAQSWWVIKSFYAREESMAFSISSRVEKLRDREGIRCLPEPRGFRLERLTARVEDLAGSLASMPFPSWDRPISIEDVPPNRARLTNSSKERSIWHRKQALERLSPYDRFFFHMVCLTDESANSDALSNPVLLLKNICRSELSCLGSGKSVYQINISTTVFCVVTAVASGISNLALSWSSPTPLLSDDNQKYLASEGTPYGHSHGFEIVLGTRPRSASRLAKKLLFQSFRFLCLLRSKVRRKSRLRPYLSVLFLFRLEGLLSISKE
ncbi:hypothetical protein ACH5RR_018384 [Cinchona calisaya]|uniref:Uncharacterized protein n=1 Tax=Cinchona calisaya TaxID=153742 RepID=A0ABD2ZLB4_9GENT